MTTLITGATGGIGEALVNLIAQRGHTLLLVARNGQKLAEQCKHLAETHGIEAQFIVADLATPDGVEHVCAEVESRGLTIDWLINNAGIGSGGAFVELSLRSELDMMHLNNAAMVMLTHFFLPGMQQRKRGVIVNVASMAAFMPVPYMAVYAASKAFVRSFTEAITEECKPHNVHVMLLCPGLTQTNFNRAAGIDNEKGKALTDGASLQTPQQVAQEALGALDQKKHVIISGTANRIGATSLALVPNSLVAKRIAQSYRKKMGI